MKWQKIRNLSVSVLLTGYLALGIGCTNNNQIFETPQNLAQRIANQVVKKSKDKVMGYSDVEQNSYGGYFDIVTRGDTIYRIGIIINDKTNEKSLIIDALKTNIDFANKNPKSREDRLKDEILYGKPPEPGIIEKLHFYDNGVDEAPETWHSLYGGSKTFQMRDLGKDSFYEWQDVSKHKLSISPKEGTNIREFLIKDGGIIVIQGSLAYDKSEKEGIRKAMKEKYMYALEDIAEVYGLKK